MADVAAGLYVAGETIETAAQIGVAAYMVTKPTQPLRATFTQIATSSDDGTRLSLSRSEHSLSIVGSKAYIFGGETAAGKLASTETHVVNLRPSDKAEPEYSIIPAVAEKEGGRLPAARKAHAACSFNVCVAVFGGVDDSGQVIDEGSNLWLFNTAVPRWEILEPTNPDISPKPRRNAHLFNHQNNLILYGGFDVTGAALKDVWRFDYAAKAWTELPDAPESFQHVTLSDGVLYAITGTDSMSGDLHYLSLTAKVEQERSWGVMEFPTNPMAPGPLPRSAAGLLPISTGYGRQYLLYFFGVRGSDQAVPDKDTESSQGVEESKGAQPQLWSDMWTYQILSSDPQIKPTTNFTDALKPAKIKDKIREALGYDDGKNSWAEVEVLPPTDLDVPEGKVHPGPRSSFASDVMEDKHSAVIWGGINPKGEREGDGWIIKLE